MMRVVVRLWDGADEFLRMRWKQSFTVSCAERSTNTCMQLQMSHYDISIE